MYTKRGRKMLKIISLRFPISEAWRKFPLHSWKEFSEKQRLSLMDELLYFLLFSSDDHQKVNFETNKCGPIEGGVQKTLPEAQRTQKLTP